jgi:23S rRNA (uracil1939-C5)-methyltransferase
MTVVTVERLGAQGDGVAQLADRQLYVPFTLAGEVVDVDTAGERARLLEVVQASPDRVTPACRHFGACGGCSLQHMAPPAYRAWKRDLVVDALARRGLECEVDALVPGAPRSRRRAVFSARRNAGGFVLGYNRALTNDIVDVVECPVVAAPIEASIGKLWSLAAIVCATRDAFHLMVTQTDAGLDIAVSGCGPLSEDARRAAAQFATREGLARLAVEGETVLEPAKPMVRFGEVAVAPPAGGFLQASAAAEGVMAEIAAHHLRKARKVADLFAGAGAFTFRLAQMASVHAVEADPRALAALDKAARFTHGLRPVGTERRDLFRRPLTAKELDAFDGVVFDPPRAGAEAQSAQIARSTVPFVAAVSCNPATLGRDLRILVDGGYALKRVVPVDQFLWSHHVEAVALLEKPRRRR